MQPEFIKPDFLEDCSVDDIHRRMMNNLPEDIDDMPGGFAYDLTRPAAIEKSEMLDFYMVRAVMLMFPQYAWGEHLDLHGQQVHITRHQAVCATGKLKITGEPGTKIAAGTVFATPATDIVDSYEYVSDNECVIDTSGIVTVSVTAVESGPESNVPENSVTIMDDPVQEISAVTNSLPISGGADEETDDDFYDRIAAEYANSMTYLGNDMDYVRWAKEAGAGDCIVAPAANGPGSVKLVLVDINGNPADEALIEAVYNHIVSPADRTKRLMPTACAQLSCVAAETKTINYKITGLQYDQTTSIEQIKFDFLDAVKAVYSKAKDESLLRYNDVRPLITKIAGVKDFSTFLVNGAAANVVLNKEEYPETGTLDFS